MKRDFADRQRPGLREVLQYCPARAGQLAPLAVPPVEPQVRLPEQISERLGVLFGCAHTETVRRTRPIVNPDGSPLPPGKARPPLEAAQRLFEQGHQALAGEA